MTEMGRVFAWQVSTPLRSRGPEPLYPNSCYSQLARIFQWAIIR
jgi:hypothetical protein